MRVLPSMEQLISNKQKLTSVQDYSVIRTSDGPLCITRLTYVNVSETTISLNGRLILCPFANTLYFIFSLSPNLAV